MGRTYPFYEHLINSWVFSAIYIYYTFWTVKRQHRYLLFANSSITMSTSTAPVGHLLDFQHRIYMQYIHLAKLASVQNSACCMNHGKGETIISIIHECSKSKLKWHNVKEKNRRDIRDDGLSWKFCIYFRSIHCIFLINKWNSRIWKYENQVVAEKEIYE